MKILKHGKLSKERDVDIDFTCSECDCSFSEVDNSDNINCSTYYYGFLRKKRKIIYRILCPECGSVVKKISFPDEWSDI